jgi:hypothetical protein
MQREFFCMMASVAIILALTVAHNNFPRTPILLWTFVLPVRLSLCYTVNLRCSLFLQYLHASPEHLCEKQYAKGISEYLYMLLPSSNSCFTSHNQFCTLSRKQRQWVHFPSHSSRWMLPGNHQVLTKADNLHVTVCRFIDSMLWKEHTSESYAAVPTHKELL